MNITQTTATNAHDVVNMIVANARIALSMSGESDATRGDVHGAIVATERMLKAAKEMVMLSLYNDIWSDELENVAIEVVDLLGECDAKLTEITGWEN